MQAGHDGVDLNAFALDDGVPHGYTPVMLARPRTIESSADELGSDRLSADEIDVDALYTNGLFE